MAQKRPTRSQDTGMTTTPGMEYLDETGTDMDVGDLPQPIGPNIPIVPLRLMASGLYRQLRVMLPIEPIPAQPIPIQPGIPTPTPTPGLVQTTEATGTIPTTPHPPIGLFNLNELRLDVDGNEPLMTASGVNYIARGRLVNWVSSLTRIAANTYRGDIWYKEGDRGLFPYTNVEIHVVRNLLPAHRRATVIFFGGGGNAITIQYGFLSPYFHTLEVEFDADERAHPVTRIDTGAHPNHPPTLPIRVLTIEDVYRRAGFDVRRSGGDNIVPIVPLSGADQKWSTTEMHDAMQHYWSRFANTAQWSLWTFFASMSDQGTSLGGIMFDDIGPNERQGCAIFTESFIANPPANDPNPAAWISRMRFWTACHEMGHTVNLAHSWQKALGTPWIPLANEPAALSFMNYPYLAAVGGQQNFFANFQYRFSDRELLFLRHAPGKFVQPGNADWFDHHGFNGYNVMPESALRLEVRVNRGDRTFSFLEPVMIELKLKNISDNPVMVDEGILRNLNNVTLVIKREGQTARVLVPYANHCNEPRRVVLGPHDSIYDAHMISVGRGGWNITEPGRYLIQAAVRNDEEDIVSMPLTLRVTPPKGYEDEFLAQDFFTDEVGRTLVFGGTRVLEKANDILRETSDRLTDRPVAIHARLALNRPRLMAYKMLKFKAEGMMRSIGAPDTQIVAQPINIEEVRKNLIQVLTRDLNLTAETLGHIKLKTRIDQITDLLAAHDNFDEAVRIQQTLETTLNARKVLKSVLGEIRERITDYERLKTVSPDERKKTLKAKEIPPPVRARHAELGTGK